jgi:hypothetical protein
MSSQVRAFEERSIEFGLPSDVQALAPGLVKAHKSPEEPRNEAEEAAAAVSGSMPSESEGEVNSSRGDSRSLKDKPNRSKTISEERSGAAEKLSVLKRDISCLKYELKKLKSMSNGVLEVENDRLSLRCLPIWQI